MTLLQIMERDPVLGITVVALATSVVISVIQAILAIVVSELKTVFNDTIVSAVKLVLSSLSAKSKMTEEGPIDVLIDWMEKYPQCVLWKNLGGEALKTGGKALILWKGWPVFLQYTEIVEETPGRLPKNSSYLLITAPLRKVSFTEDLISYMTPSFDPGPEKKVLRLIANENRRILPPREMDSVILPGNQKETLINTLEEFLGSREWYTKRGLPYRMGILLEGTPGSGKTSLAKALSSHFGLNLILTKGSYNIDRAVNSWVGSWNFYRTGEDGKGKIHPEPTIVLIEDLSALNLGTQKNTGLASDEGSSLLTLSEFLNIVDGVSTPEGIIFIFTANNVEALDPALLRHGRVDLRIKFHHASKGQAGQMFSRFYPEHSHLADEFASYVPDQTLSMAQIQYEFSARKRDPFGVLEWAKQLVKDPTLSRIHRDAS